jgi:type 1 glutamine amidotransferase/HEAT repeat protein
MNIALHAIMLPALATLAALTTLDAKPGETFPPLTARETSAIDAAAPETARAKPQKPRKLLVFHRTEGFVHKSIPNASHALQRMGERTGAYTVTLSDDMAQFDPATLAAYDAVLFNNTSQLKFENPAHRQSLLDFVRNGKGLIGIHAGSDNFPTWPEGQALMGGVFHSHPWVAKDTVAVKNDDPAHILNTAFEKRGFWITEEIYQIVGPYSREKQRVLLSLDMSRPENARPAAKIARPDNDFPISWLKTESKGRVFYTSLGHNKDIFETPQILQHLLDGIQYALGDLQADAIPSAQLATPPTPALAPDDKTPIQKLTALPTLAALSTYEVGDPLAPQLAYEKHLRAAPPAQRAAAETDLIALIAAPATTTAAKCVFANWLGWIGTEKSIPTLTAAVKDPALAHAAISALATISNPEANGALSSLINQNHIESIRIEAANAYGQRRLHYSPDALAEIANPHSTAALEALANIATPDAIETLRALSFSGAQEIPHTRALLAATGNLLRRDPSAKNRNLAIDIYAGTLRAATALTAQIETAQALVSLDPVNQALFVFPMDSDPRLRNVIACGMATSGNAGAIELITGNYASIPADTICRMLTALATKPTATALPLIDIALASENPDVQLAAIVAAAACGDNTTVAKLLPFLSSKNKDTAAATFAALTQLPDCDGKTNSALRIPDFALQPNLLLILAQRQDRTIFPTALATTATINTTATTTTALATTVSATAATATTTSSVSASTADTLRAAAFEAIALLVRPGDLPQILPLAANLKRPADRREWTKALYTAAASHPDAGEAAALLQKQLPAATPADRASLIAALTMVQSDTAKTALTAMLTDSDIDVRKETIRALSSARTETAYDLLIGHIAAATDTTERLLAQRGAIDTLDALTTISTNDKVAAYRNLWKTAGTQEPKDAIIAAVKRIKGTAAAALLKEIAPAKTK